MSIKSVLEIGLKVALALGAGLAMFMGVNEAVKSSKQPSQSSNGNTENCSSGPDPVGNNKATGAGGRAVISGLRAAQSTCGKLFSLTQGLVTIAESIRTLSDTKDDYYDGGGYYSPYQGGGGQRWRRVNPFIMESIPTGAPINYSNQYPC